MLYMRIMSSAGSAVLFGPFVRGRHLELDHDGVVWVRARDGPGRFVPEARLGPVLGCPDDLPEALAAELAVLRDRWQARDRLEDLAAEARRSFDS